jgi:general transcription factor 3C polypeptide 4
VHRPGDFSYKHDAKQKSVLVVASLWDSASEDILLLEWEKVLSRVKACKSDPLQQAMMLTFAGIASGRAPLDVLRPILFSMRSGKRLNLVHGKALEVLRRGLTDSDDMMLDIDPGLGRSTWKGKARANVSDNNDKNLKEGFRKSISKHLFGWDTVATWRVKLGLADYIWVSAHQYR